MTTWIALLRGINLGSHNRVAMPELRERLERAGFGRVRTVVQSGNIVLDSDLGADGVAASVGEVVEEGFGVATPVVVRSAADLDAVIAANPMRDEAESEPKRFQVSFLAAIPDPDGLERLLGGDYGDERVAASGREIYCHHPGGLQRSKLAAAFSDKSLGTAVTARNWNTVTKLAALAAE